jgi:hypothetical protein
MGAHDPAVAQPPAPADAALRAHEPLRPPHPLQVVQAVSIGAEPRLELSPGPGVVPAPTEPGLPAKSTPVKWRPPDRRYPRLSALRPIKTSGHPDPGIRRVRGSVWPGIAASDKQL